MIFIANPIWPPDHVSKSYILLKVTSTLTNDDTDEISGQTVHYFWGRRLLKYYFMVFIDFMQITRLPWNHVTNSIYFLKHESTQPNYDMT